MTNIQTNITGGCMCKQVRYLISAQPDMFIVCHCIDCQKETGSAFLVEIQIPRTCFRITQGNPTGFTSTADSGSKITKYFCPECGSSLYSNTSSHPSKFDIRIGGLDDRSIVDPKMHVFASRKQKWFDIPQKDKVQIYQDAPPAGDEKPLFGQTW
eukprot:TRINITY_DN578_c0_g1_i1.p1 TRINITY_DN578_c0_g1~~TRINITY_DN578_c0_g1_i1.p1  ORF type:complete len:155 (+),score=25.01 TRINITY_DN578_c0_g1_i1:80-544(+)